MLTKRQMDHEKYTTNSKIAIICSYSEVSDLVYGDVWNMNSMFMG